MKKLITLLLAVALVGMSVSVASAPGKVRQDVSKIQKSEKHTITVVQLPATSEVVFACATNNLYATPVDRIEVVQRTEPVNFYFGDRWRKNQSIYYLLKQIKLQSKTLLNQRYNLVVRQC